MPPFQYKEISLGEIPFPLDSYQTPPGLEGFWASRLPSFFYSWYVFDIIRHEGSLACAGTYYGKEWAQGSLRTLRLLEYCGVKFHVQGLDNIDKPDGPCVFIGNHMSTLETFVLPVFIQPRRNVTFVVKDSLLKYPWFGPVLKSRDPIVVHRQNPRQDLAAVLEDGAERLAKGISVVVFPQSTRSTALDPALFNSIGVKLAKRAGVPVIPFALRTDAWKNGKYIKDYGGLDPAKPVRFAFGEPLRVTGNGKAEHAAVWNFVSEHAREWGLPVNGDDSGH
ncbi:MAG: 1-acyl-sn-glycerol-3-phosphate acyltransferase [Desulfovibrio sp.]|nr:1-acyl-sn-glycerol-3-phosphate acyltransferase [Desulfovibrio sp.]